MFYPADMTFEQLTDFVVAQELPKFRAGQIAKWLASGVFDFEQMTDLSKPLREKLSRCASLPVIDPVKKFVDPDGTVKYLFRLHDGALIETVVMNYRHGNSVCISSQVGCRMNCAFCASSLTGLQRCLTAGEMLAQIEYVNRENKVSSVVVMGIGEPFDNFDNIVLFLRNISDPRIFGLSLRHVSVSTCGIVPKIDELAAMKLQLTLSVSLHAPDDETRNKIMPVNRKWNISQLMDACRRYIASTGRRISFEYTLIDGINSSPAQAEKLAALLKGMLCHVNLIPVNYVMERGMRPAPPEAVRKFQSVLEDRGINVTVRRTLGEEINAACGQLRHVSSKENS